MIVRTLVVSSLVFGVLASASAMAQASAPPETVSKDLLNADALLSTKHYDDAIPIFEHVLKSEAPRSDKAHAESRLGYAFYYKGDLTSALEPADNRQHFLRRIPNTPSMPIFVSAT